jgi:hypothetical protein
MAWDDEPMFKRKSDAMHVWRAIKKHLPHITASVEDAAQQAADPVGHFMAELLKKRSNS